MITVYGEVFPLRAPGGGEEWYGKLHDGTLIAATWPDAGSAAAGLAVEYRRRRPLRRNAIQIACENPAEMLECVMALGGLWTRGAVVAADWAQLALVIEQRISQGHELVPALLPPSPAPPTQWRFSR